MSGTLQRAELHRSIWQIANDVRGSIDGWDFKQYVLGTLFYRFISEKFAQYAGQDYSSQNDADVSAPETIATIVEEIGYFIKPSELFCNVVESLKDGKNIEDLNIRLREIFDNIEKSAENGPSRDDIKGLFASFDVTSDRLGGTTLERNRRLADVLRGIANLNFSVDEEGHKIDTLDIDMFGDAYEFLISNYAANAGKSGGEFFTPQAVSRLLSKIALDGLDNAITVYDPACGSGSLLLQAIKLHKEQGKSSEYIKFEGQEINPTTYNLARMNMFLHGVSYNNFDIRLGDTLVEPKHNPNAKYDAIVSNPPYSIKWKGKEDPALLSDPRFVGCGGFPPVKNADFAFVLHSLYHLSDKGRAAIVTFPGIFYRSGEEKKIRKYLVDSNYVEAVISLAPNLFFGTSIAVNILVLNKHKTDNNVIFIDASTLYKKETNNNVLTNENIDEIMALFKDPQNIEHRSSVVSTEEIANNDYSLAVSAYVEPEDTREKINIEELNEELADIVERINELRSQIDTIVKEIDAKK